MDEIELLFLEDTDYDLVVSEQVDKLNDFRIKGRVKKQILEKYEVIVELFSKIKNRYTGISDRIKKEYIEEYYVKLEESLEAVNESIEEVNRDNFLNKTLDDLYDELDFLKATVSFLQRQYDSILLEIKGVKY